MKLLVEEGGSELAVDRSDGCDAAMPSHGAYPEVRAALAAAGRYHDLDEGDLELAERAREEYWATTRTVELTSAVEQHAVRSQLRCAGILRCVRSTQHP